MTGILILAGCDKPGKTTSVTVMNAMCNGPTCGVARLDPVAIRVKGEGVCSEIQAQSGQRIVPFGRQLLLCVNDDYPYDNTGGWEVHISIDESRAS